jgi:hypothetical protein
MSIQGNILTFQTGAIDVSGYKGFYTFASSDGTRKTRFITLSGEEVVMDFYLQENERSVLSKYFSSRGGRYSIEIEHSDTKDAVSQEDIRFAMNTIKNIFAQFEVNPDEETLAKLKKERQDIYGPCSEDFEKKIEDVLSVSQKKESETSE